MKKVYIVQYSTGSYDSYEVHLLFATTKKSVATKYVTRFNRILKTLEDRNKKFENVRFSTSWICDKYLKDYGKSWSRVRETNRANWEELEMR